MPDLRPVASELCAALFTGAQIEHARAHRITSPFCVEPHAHPDLFQFDWMVNCRGSATIDGGSTRLDACTLMLVAPRQSHAMSLLPAGDAARVYHARIRLPANARRRFRGTSILLTGQPASAPLESALNDVWRLTVGAPGRSLLRLTRLAEAIALWPGADDEGGAARATTTAGLDRDLDAALAMMERSLLSPPALEELAEASHLSVRQFTRRFRDALGIPPMAFLDRKRLALAQQMLAYEASSVTEVAQRMHFSSAATFSRWFGNLAGESPSQYRSRPHTL